MLMKMEILIGEQRADSMTSPQNQVVEIQSFSGFEGLAGLTEKEMLNNDERSLNVL
jgi:hypothetical protein